MTTIRQLIFTLLVVSFLSIALGIIPPAHADDLWSPRPRHLQPKLGAPIDGLSDSQLAKFNQGLSLFKKSFTESEGLGPVFNGYSCGGSCHVSSRTNGMGITGGGGGTGPSDQIVMRFGRIDSNGHFDPLKNLGGSLYRLRSAYFGNLDCSQHIPSGPDIVTAFRIPKPLFGIGLIEAIRDSDLIALSKVRKKFALGRLSEVPLLENPKQSGIGRFGWKAQAATVLSFSADALLNEMGITNEILKTESPEYGYPPLPAGCIKVGDPENITFLPPVVAYQKYLAPPPQTPRSGMIGEQIFKNIGCAECHTPGFVTPYESGTNVEPVLQARILRPYSDFLLHDMGKGGDGIGQGVARPSEMMTAALWGITARGGLLHGGLPSGTQGYPVYNEYQPASVTFERWKSAWQSAIDNTVQVHASPGSEALPSANLYNKLSKAQKNSLTFFLLSLGRAEFDGDYDGVIGPKDLHLMAECSKLATVDADNNCAVFDFNQDGRVDSNDFTYFLSAYEGPKRDDNVNGQVDALDIFLNPSLDINKDGIINNLNKDGMVENPVAAKCPSIINRPKDADPTWDPNVDSDHDGIKNCLDECWRDPNKTRRGACGCGISDIDSDQDGVPDCFDDCPQDPLFFSKPVGVIELMATDPTITRKCQCGDRGPIGKYGVPVCFETAFKSRPQPSASPTSTP